LASVFDVLLLTWRDENHFPSLQVNSLPADVGATLARLQNVGLRTPVQDVRFGGLTSFQASMGKAETEILPVVFGVQDFPDLRVVAGFEGGDGCCIFMDCFQSEKILNE